MVKIQLADEKELSEDKVTEVDFARRPAILFKWKGQVHAYINACTHLGGPCELKGGKLECKWHDSHFDPETGNTTKGPAPLDSRLIKLPVQVEDGKVYYVYG